MDTPEIEVDEKSEACRVDLSHRRFGYKTQAQGEEERGNDADEGGSSYPGEFRYFTYRI